MSTTRKTTVGVIFGGRSVEHDVSIVTANQILHAFDSERYEVVPIYITRDGSWFTGDPLKNIKNYQGEIISYKGVQTALLSPCIRHHGLILNPMSGRLRKSEIKRLDVIFPAVHGTHGEDGTLQGLIELADIPYVGCGVMGSAISNDKAMTKLVLRQKGIPVVDDLVFTRAEWLADRDAILKKVNDTLSYPLFVKPTTLGSSIGVARAANPDTLSMSIDIAASFDNKVLVEPGVAGSVEINCAVMGYGSEFEASVLEQPVSWEDFLTYEEKYLRGDGGMKGAERIIPAPLDDELTAKIKQMTIDAFRAVDGRGTARIDFLLRGHDDDNVETEIYLNEINTMPGSLAFYLWQEMGVSNREVVEKLVKLAQDAFADKRRNTYNYQTSLIEVTAARGLKGLKGPQNKPSDSN
jgi:D-alanine-D-alanine ligase